MATTRRRLSFPDPTEVTDATGVAFRSKEEIITLYNQSIGTTAKQASSLSGTVREWVNKEAAGRGWGTVYWPLAYPNRTLYAGGVFVKGVVIAK